MSFFASVASDTSAVSLAVFSAGLGYALHALHVFSDPSIDVTQLVCSWDIVAEEGNDVSIFYQALDVYYQPTIA